MKGEEELNSEESLKAIFEVSVDPVFIKDFKGKYVKINKACVETFGIPKEEIIGKTDLDIFPEKVANEILRVDKKVFQGEVIKKDVSRIIGGKNYFFEISKLPLYDENGEIYGLVGIARDVSLRKYLEKRQSELETELLKEKRLSSIGHLISGIVHNINNPLTVILGRAQLLKMEMPGIKELDTIISQSKKIQGIMDNMNIKSCREKDTSKKLLDLNELLSIELTFLVADSFYKHEIKKDFQFQEGLPSIEAVYGDFSQCINSIIHFSMELMRNSDQKILSVKTSSDKDFIYVDISDTGCGISREDVSELFAPIDDAISFRKNSKEERQRALRLSLYKSYLLLNKYEVKIDVKSRVGKGTTFTMKIPYSGDKTTQ